MNNYDDIIKNANVIEKRIDDSCTIEMLLKDNITNLHLAKKYNVNYILIDNKYQIDIEL